MIWTVALIGFHLFCFFFLSSFHGPNNFHGKQRRNCICNNYSKQKSLNWSVFFFVFSFPKFEFSIMIRHCQESTIIICGKYAPVFARGVCSWVHLLELSFDVFNVGFCMSYMHRIKNSSVYKHTDTRIQCNHTHLHHRYIFNELESERMSNRSTNRPTNQPNDHTSEKERKTQQRKKRKRKYTKDMHNHELSLMGQGYFRSVALFRLY